LNNLTIVGLSRWLQNCAKESSLLCNSNIVNLPNLIDTDIFKPIEKNHAREKLGLSQNKKYILFGAMRATGDPRKGYDKLQEALKKLNDPLIEFVVFGNNEPSNCQGLTNKTHFLGDIQDDGSLQIIYNACDVIIVPSIQENLSNIILESLSCGSPVVAFDIGGNSDMIDHLNNGYLAEPFDTDDLAEGIEWVINNKNYIDLKKNARKKILKSFDSEIVIQKYLELYKDILTVRNNER